MAVLSRHAASQLQRDDRQCEAGVVKMDRRRMNDDRLEIEWPNSETSESEPGGADDQVALDKKKHVISRAQIAEQPIHQQDEREAEPRKRQHAGERSLFTSIRCKHRQESEQGEPTDHGVFIDDFEKQRKQNKRPKEQEHGRPTGLQDYDGDEPDDKAGEALGVSLVRPRDDRVHGTQHRQGSFQVDLDSSNRTVAAPGS